jgi:peptidoglycan/LPS O-acetylase OafA/YrhL
MILSAPKLDALTGLRFFAAIAIVIHHLRGFGLPNNVFEGWLLDNGVSLFFVLSGFILTYVYPSLDTRGAIRRFWLARFARIWPAHITALALCYLLLDGDPSKYGTGVNTLTYGIANILLVHAWIPYAESFFSYNSVSWSISTEAFFYLAFPILISAFSRTWWLKLIAVSLISLALIYICIATGLQVYTAPGQGLTLTGILYINPLTRLFEFTLGMCTALLWRNTHDKLRAGMIVGTLVELAVIILMLASSRAVAQLCAWANSEFGFAAAQWLGQGGGMALNFAGLIFVMALHQGLISRALGSRIGIFLGEISFMIYLIHYVLLRAYTMRIEWFSEFDGGTLLFAYCVALFSLATLLWHFIEKPMRKLIMRQFAPAA